MVKTHALELTNETAIPTNNNQLGFKHSISLLTVQRTYNLVFSTYFL